MTGAEFSSAFRRAQTEYFSKHKEAEAAFKRIKRGTATQSDVYIITEALGETAEKALKKTLGDIEITDIEVFTEYILENILNTNFSVSMAFADVVQSQINEAAGIGFNVKEVTLSASRVKGLKEQVKDATTGAEIAGTLDGKVSNILQSGLDGFIRANAKAYEGAGLEPIYQRIWDGVTGSHDTKHTDYCNTLAGSFKKSEIPKNFYVRHERCNCRFNLFPDGKTKEKLAVIRKGEKDVNGELWNTGKVTSNSRKAVLRRRREQYGATEARKMLNEEWKGGLNGLAERYF